MVVSLLAAMLALLAALCAWYEALYKTISVSDFASIIWKDAIDNGTALNVQLADYLGFAAKGYFVIPDAGDNIPFSHNYTYYRITGTPKEIAEARKLANPIQGPNGTAPLPEGRKVYIVRFVKEASYTQLSTFWVTLVISLLVVGAMLTAFLLWHCDPYAKDPANSLLFVTDGNRIVTGE
jgi:hypothetical protein